MQAARAPAVAGRFYPGDPSALEAEVARYLPEPRAGARARMVMAPHAGYVYSGAIAGATYARVSVPDVAVVLCPNHTGLGARRSLWPDGSWQLPGFELAVDGDLAARVQRECSLSADRLAHVREHAIEVQLPFLHAQNAEVAIVPLCLGGLDWRDCDHVGAGLARAIAELEREGKRSVLLVASTDMSHYIPAPVAKELDGHALDRVLALDARGLHDVVTREDISMCGYIPTTVALVAAKALGAGAAELVRYGNSGDVSGDYDRVVGYAGIVVH